MQTGSSQFEGACAKVTSVKPCVKGARRIRASTHRHLTTSHEQAGDNISRGWSSRVFMKTAWLQQTLAIAGCELSFCTHLPASGTFLFYFPKIGLGLASLPHEGLRERQQISMSHPQFCQVSLPLACPWPAMLVMLEMLVMLALLRQRPGGGSFAVSLGPQQI